MMQDITNTIENAKSDLDRVEFLLREGKEAEALEQLQHVRFALFCLDNLAFEGVSNDH